MMLSSHPALAVSSAPNASVIEGRVVKVAVLVSSLANIEPDMDIYELVIDVASVGHADEPFPAPVSQGQRITVLTKERVSQDVLRKMIKARVSHRGDENGGALWLSDLDITDAQGH